MVKINSSLPRGRVGASAAHGRAARDTRLCGSGTDESLDGAGGCSKPRVGASVTRYYGFRFVNRVNPGDAVGQESWSSRYISDSLSKNALKCRPITSLEAKQLNE